MAAFIAIFYADRPNKLFTEPHEVKFIGLDKLSSGQKFVQKHHCQFTTILNRNVSASINNCHYTIQQVLKGNTSG